MTVFAPRAETAEAADRRVRPLRRPRRVRKRSMERDFANGYLFAEILHRYFPGEVSMHSFDKNASSVHKKRDNWSVLLKPLKKAGFDVTTREWEAICAAEDGAAVTFVGKMHRRLAGGSATMPPPSSASGGSRRTSARFGDGGRRGEDADDRGGDDSWEDARFPRAAKAMTTVCPGASHRMIIRHRSSTGVGTRYGGIRRGRAPRRRGRARLRPRPPPSSGSSRARAAGSTGRRTSAST